MLSEIMHSLSPSDARHYVAFHETEQFYQALEVKYRHLSKVRAKLEAERAQHRWYYQQGIGAALLLGLLATGLGLLGNLPLSIGCSILSTVCIGLSYQSSKKMLATKQNCKEALLSITALGPEIDQANEDRVLKSKLASFCAMYNYVEANVQTPFDDFVKNEIKFTEVKDMAFGEYDKLQLIHAILISVAHQLHWPLSHFDIICNKNKDKWARVTHEDLKMCMHQCELALNFEYGQMHRYVKTAHAAGHA